MSDFRIKTCVLDRSAPTVILYTIIRQKDAVVVDPADNAPYILNKCSELGLRPRAVLLTHGHCDHTSAAADVCRSFRIPIYGAAAEENLLLSPSMNLSSHMWAEQ